MSDSSLKSLIFKLIKKIKNINIFPNIFNCFSFINYNNKFIITFGGYDTQNCFDDIYIYNMEKQKWNKSNIKLPKKISNSSAVIYKNNVHIIGGDNTISHLNVSYIEEFTFYE